jgi:hypothetical protein
MKLFVLPCMLTEAVFDTDFAWNVKLIVYVFPLTNLHGSAVQPVTSNVWIVPDTDPQSLYGVAVHIKLNEEDNIKRMNNENIFV